MRPTKEDLCEDERDWYEPIECPGCGASGDDIDMHPPLKIDGRVLQRAHADCLKCGISFGGDSDGR